MKRRNLLKLSALFGTTTALPWLASTSRAQTTGYQGPYWLFVTASGGWDPRFMFDPTLNPAQNRLYTELGEIGNIAFAPIDATPDEFGITLLPGEVAPYLNPERFATRFGSRMLVVNGVDTATNNHDAGRRAVTSGTIQENLPALGAMLASTYGLSQPLPFISFGGYDSTFDVAPLSRIGSGAVLRDLAAPNLINPDQEMAEGYHTSDTYLRIRAAQNARLGELLSTDRLPKFSASERALLEARATDQELRALQAPELIDLPGNLNGAENLLREGQLAMAAFRAGIAVSANLEIGGFDTHGNHDVDQRRNVIQLLTGVGALLDQIELAGMTNNVFVLIGSDFGRTPYYNGENDGAGKDHWPITSTIIMGPGVEGNRVVGATTDDQNAVLVDPNTLASGAGIKITPGEIHAALRRLAVIDPELEMAYPVAGGSLRLFG